MGKTFNTVNIKPDIQSYVANSIKNSGSFLESFSDSLSDPSFLAGKDSGEYNTFSKKGAFYADLTEFLGNQDQFSSEADSEGVDFGSTALAYLPYVIFNQTTNEFSPQLTVFNTTYGGATYEPYSGFPSFNNISTLLPFNVKVEGLVFDNRAKAVGEAAYMFITVNPLTTVNEPPSGIANDFQNVIPSPSYSDISNATITLTAAYNGNIIIPAPPPLGESPFSYNFSPLDTIRLRVAGNGNFPTDNGFDALVTSFNQNTRELVFTPIENTGIGNWANSNRWIITNTTNNDSTYVVNLILDNIVHFEMQFSAYPIHYNQTSVFPSPADHDYLGYAVSGNPTQFSSPNGDYVSQLTYRKFWSPSLEANSTLNNPNGISNYGNYFNHLFSVDSFADNRVNGFNLNLESQQTFDTEYANIASYSLNGGFKREGHVVVRGTYNIY